jgi:hypothetical protein
LSNGNLFVDMESFTKQAILFWGDTEIQKYPAEANLFKDIDDDPLPDEKRIKFHSCVARLIFLAKRTRSDIAPAVSHLNSRVKRPTQDDWRKLDYLFGYLKFTAGLGMLFLFGSDGNPKAFTDASFLAHSDMISRSGILIMMAGGTIFISSTKQKLVTKSTAEAELVALCDGATALLILRKFLIAQGCELGPSLILEDNKSTIELVKAGRPTSFRTKHIAMRYFFVKQHIDSGELGMEHCLTENMSDMLTKPMVGAQFIFLRDQVVVKMPVER